MYKTCSRCGKIHPFDYKCNVGKIYKGGEERTLRNTYAWEKKSKEIRDKAQHLCEVCRQEGRLTYNNIEVHHITKVRDDVSLLLDDLNLVCLCR
ncbi:MAG: HNH endonuclease, partial [Paludibacteraceae bacterium]|nr:HNH endonuclease [Paludibacteraceae bacterium]